MKLYVVTADTYIGCFGSTVELLKVADNKESALISAGYAEEQGWIPKITVVEENKPIRKYLGGHEE